MLPEQKTEIINALSICAATCGRCVATCSQRHDHIELVKCIALAGDCEMLCRNAASVVNRNSGYSMQVLRECIEVCKLCMRACLQLGQIECCRVSANACSECIRVCETGLQAMA